VGTIKQLTITNSIEFLSDHRMLFHEPITRELPQRYWATWNRTVRMGRLYRWGYTLTLLLGHCSYTI